MIRNDEKKTINHFAYCYPDNITYYLNTGTESNPNISEYDFSFLFYFIFGIIKLERSDFMKKRLLLIGLVILLGILLFVLVCNHSKEEIPDKGSIPNNSYLSIEEVKSLLFKTDKVYVCSHQNSLDKICNKDALKKIIAGDKKEELVSLLASLEQSKDDGINDVLDLYTLYLVNQEGKILFSIDYSHHVIIKLKEISYYMDTNENTKIDAILDLSK